MTQCSRLGCKSVLQLLRGLLDLRHRQASRHTAGTLRQPLWRPTWGGTDDPTGSQHPLTRQLHGLATWKWILQPLSGFEGTVALTAVHLQSPEKP